MSDQNLHSRLIRLAAAKPELRAALLPLITSQVREAADKVRMIISPKFYIDSNLRRNTVRVMFTFGVKGTERTGYQQINANLSEPFSPALEAHLHALWESDMYDYDGIPYKGPPFKDFVRGALLRDAERAATTAGARAGADTVVLESITIPRR